MLVMRRDIIIFMVQDSVVDQRSEDDNNKLRGAVVVEITISYPGLGCIWPSSEPALMILLLRICRWSSNKQFASVGEYSYP